MLERMLTQVGAAMCLIFGVQLVSYATMTDGNQIWQSVLGGMCLGLVPTLIRWGRAEYD